MHSFRIILFTRASVVMSSPEKDSYAQLDQTKVEQSLPSQSKDESNASTTTVTDDSASDLPGASESDVTGASASDLPGASASDMTGASAADSSATTDAAQDSEDEGGLAHLLSFMKDKLHIGDSKKKEETPKILSSLDLDGIVEFMKSDKCQNIITMAGAGISTSAGIPDFRSPGSGLYSNLQKYDLPYPEAIFELEYFCKDPQPFFTLARELYPGSFNPTPCHYFIKMLEKKGLLMRHYTQNIDTLEHIAGISEDKVVEAHGSFRTAHCLHCNKLYTQQWIKDEIFAERVPSCTSCAGVVKPDIVFFGEGLPPKFFQCLQSDFPKCDLLIILGTSLTVQPFASLVDNVPSSCPRLLINREAVGSSSMLSMVQRLMAGMGGGLQLNSPSNSRDVALLGDCDEGCYRLIDSLGWRDEFDAMVAEDKSKSAS